MFAESLLESAPHPGHRSAWTKLVSAMAQSIAVAALLAVPLLHLEPLRFIPLPPSVLTTAVDQSPMTQEVRSAGSQIAPRLLVQEIVQPNHIPSQIAQLHDRQQSAEPPSAVGLGCSPACSPSAALTNIFTAGTPMPDIRPPRPSHPIPVSEMQLGALVHKVVPAYPQIAKSAGIQGTVLLSALIGKDGRVESVTVLSGHPMLARAAEDAVRQWQYRPYILNREPVAVQTSITMHFTLSGNQ